MSSVGLHPIYIQWTGCELSATTLYNKPLLAKMPMIDHYLSGHRHALSLNVVLFCCLELSRVPLIRSHRDWNCTVWSCVEHNHIVQSRSPRHMTTKYNFDHGVHDHSVQSRSPRHMTIQNNFDRSEIKCDQMGQELFINGTAHLSKIPLLSSSEFGSIQYFDLYL